MKNCISKYKYYFFCAIFCASCIFLTPNVIADTIYLTSGETVKGLVVEEYNDRIVLSTYKGEVQMLSSSIDEIFFDNEEQNYKYLGDKALENNDFDRALSFYQKAYQINPESGQIADAFPRLIDAIDRHKLKIKAGESMAKLKQQSGIIIENFKDKIRVKSVSKNSPAQKAGMVAGDFIIDVWGSSLMFMNDAEAAQAMIGAPSRPVKISIEKNITVPMKSVCWINKFFPCFHFANSDFEVSLKPVGLIVDKVNTQGPAGENVLHVMDIITHIDGESTKYMPLSSARKKIYNSPKEIILTVKRQVVLTRGGL